MGRVCYRPCETACNRAQLDSAVGINSVERFLGDEAIRRGWKVPVAAAPTGKRVLVVGAGPSGLSAAYHLTRLGHSVTIKDAGAAARRHDALRHPEVPAAARHPGRRDRAASSTWASRSSSTPGSPTSWPSSPKLPAAAEADGFDAAFVAVGAHIGRRAYIPAGDSARIMDAVSLLHGMEDGTPPMLGRRVAVYGGGNTAMDAARTARRLGATEAVVVYRRTRDRMPAHDIEVTEALDEGVTMRWLSTIAHADEGKLLIEKMRLDETGFPQPTGEFEELEADCLVLALGQNADLSVLEDVPGVTFSDNVDRRRPGPDDRAPGHLRRRGHGAVRADRHRRHRPRQEGRAAHRRVAARHGRYTARGQARARRVRRASTPGTTPTPRPPCGPRWRPPGGSPPSTR